MLRSLPPNCYSLFGLRFHPSFPAETWHVGSRITLPFGCVACPRHGNSLRVICPRVLHRRVRARGFARAKPAGRSRSAGGFAGGFCAGESTGADAAVENTRANDSQRIAVAWARDATEGEGDS